MATLTGTINCDGSYESGFRGQNPNVCFGGVIGYVTQIERALLAFGLVRTSDSGQSNFNQTLISSNVSTGSGFGAGAAFDGSTATYWQTNMTPTTGSPAILWYDAGADTTNTIPTTPVVTNYKIYYYANNADPAAWTVAGSNDGVAWAVLDTQTGQSNASAAYKSYSFANATGYRYYRLSITATVGAVNLVFGEWQQFTGAGATAPVPAFVKMNPNDTSGKVVMSFWKFTDALQASAPVVIGLSYGNLSYSVSPSVTVTVGSTTNGAGVFTGNSQAVLLVGAVNSAARFTASGASNRVGIVNGYSATTTPFAFFIERTHDATGADTADGICIVYTRSAPNPARGQATIPFTGTMPTLETDIALLTPTSNTGLRNANISLFPNFPVMGTSSQPVLMNPMTTHMGCFIADITPDTVFTAVVNGASHNYICVGYALTPFSRGAVTGSTCAMLFE